MLVYDYAFRRRPRPGVGRVFLDMLTMRRSLPLCRAPVLQSDVAMPQDSAARFRPAALAFLMVACSSVVHGQPTSAAVNPAGIVPYVSAAMAVIRSKGARFADGGDSGHPALYGNVDSFDAGAVDNGPQLGLAVGGRLPSGLRAQLELGVARSLDYRGNTNYRNTGTRQPSEARLNTRQLLLTGFFDFPGRKMVSGRALRPFVGVGVGLTRYRLSDYVQRFPEPDNPDGYLRRGPGGEIPFTGLPGGSGRNRAWMLAAGVGVQLRENIHLDLSYRYTDAGEIRTDVGDITIVRYRVDGTRRETRVRINETASDFRTHSLLVTLRFDL